MHRNRDLYRRDAQRPHHVPLRGWWQVAQGVWAESSRGNLSVVAAGCAFFALLAIFPALSALISLYGLTADPTTVERHFAVLADVLPKQAYGVVIEQIRRIADTSSQSLGWSFAFSLGLAFWSANYGTRALMMALNIAYGEPERRSVLQFYLSAFTFTLAGILGGVIILLALVYIPVFFAFTGYSQAFELLVKAARWPLLAILVLLLLALFYRYGPCRRTAKWRWVTAGSLFAATVWLLASAGFSVYVSNFAHYDRMYGSLGAVIVLLLWLYLSYYIVLLGAAINAELELRTAEDTTAQPPGSTGGPGVTGGPPRPPPQAEKAKPGT